MVAVSTARLLWLVGEAAGLPGTLGDDAQPGCAPMKSGASLRGVKGVMYPGTLIELAISE
ncbi:MAG: hypothetical protein NVS4B9_19900 [Ktedonobacteraceae bacterium]